MERPPGLMAMVVAVGLVSACGSGSSAPRASAAPPDAVKFVGNSTCPIDVPAGAPAGTVAATPYDPNPPATNGTPVGQVIPEMPHTHVAPPTQVHYQHNPPTSGCHYSLGPPAPAPIQPGAYNAPVPPEYWVHNLEHGYVAVLYDCPAGCDSDFQQLVSWLKKQPHDLQGQRCSPPIGYAKIIVLPDRAMPVKFAAVAWDYYDPMSHLDLAEIQRFYDNHNGHAPEGVCIG